MKHVLVGSARYHGEIIDVPPGVSRWVVPLPSWEIGEREEERFVRTSYWPGFPFAPVDVFLIEAWFDQLGDPGVGRYLVVLINSALKSFWRAV